MESKEKKGTRPSSFFISVTAGEGKVQGGGSLAWAISQTEFINHHNFNLPIKNLWTFW